LHFHGAVQIQLLHAGLGRFIPFLQDLGHGGLIDLDELLQFVQITIELLESFEKRHKV
jgi:hypothetical protein